jgi:L-serine dehydratase
MDRRAFLKTAALAAAGAGAMRHLPAQARGIPAAAFPELPKDVCYPGPPATTIATTVLDLFKIGPGPSSSHTLAPLRIASDFRSVLEALPPETLARVARLRARLHGSLSATGKGHRTDRAVLAGLLGQKPESCDPAVMDALADAQKRHETNIGGKRFILGHDAVVWDTVEHAFPFSNTLIMEAVDGDGKVVVSREYYSTGGGFFAWKGQPEARRGAPVHAYGSMAAFMDVCRKTGKAPHVVLMENETAILGLDAAAVDAHLDMVLDVMIAGVELGLREEGLLPAPFEFYRKAKRLHEEAFKLPEGERLMQLVSSYAIAVSEGNAAGRLAVTAPTLGSAGTMPAVVYLLDKHVRVSREALRRGLLFGALAGYLCKNNASVAGAEVGCQGEIGVASAMAAAMAAYATDASPEAAEVAATIALEHHLGMSCDPVGGFVLIPCIERNAFGALKAYNACLMAKSEIVSRHWEDFDRVVMAMLQTGKALPPAFREMGTAGLGMTMVDC